MQTLTGQSEIMHAWPSSSSCPQCRHGWWVSSRPLSFTACREVRVLLHCSALLRPPVARWLAGYAATRRPRQRQRHGRQRLATCALSAQASSWCITAATVYCAPFFAAVRRPAIIPYANSVVRRIDELGKRVCAIACLRFCTFGMTLLQALIPRYTGLACAAARGHEATITFRADLRATGARVPLLAASLLGARYAAAYLTWQPG